MLIETLTQEEARVLGTLAEKSLATPDYYPLTLNSLRTACNQKSNRDPVTEYNDEIVSLALTGLKRKVLVTFIPYGSQGNHYKYRHFLEDPRFHLSQEEIAILAVLLLRGKQTLNEVKLRASSLTPLDSLEATEALLQGLANRPEPLTEYLPKRPGWKEPRWTDKLAPRHAEMESPSESDIEGDAKQETEEKPHTTIKAMQLALSDLAEKYAALKADVEKIKSELY
jgi:uncharacterized protein YceH (UPF0502 family)